MGFRRAKLLPIFAVISYPALADAPHWVVTQFVDTDFGDGSVTHRSTASETIKDASGKSVSLDMICDDGKEPIFAINGNWTATLDHVTGALRSPASREAISHLTFDLVGIHGYMLDGDRAATFVQAVANARAAEVTLTLNIGGYPYSMRVPNAGIQEAWKEVLAQCR